jgi:hypothetical protein
MPLSDRDRKLIIDSLESLESALIQVIMSTFESFVRWLFAQLPDVYRRVRDEIGKLWRSLKKAFA